MDLLIASVRFVQFTAAVALFGAPLFFLYALGEAARSGDSMLAWGRGLVRWSSGPLLVGALASLLVRRHKESLYRLLRRYTGDTDEAYEAVQEAFIAAWGALRRYDPERSFGAWLRTIAINKARDRGRRMAVRRMIFGAQSLEDSAAMEAFDPAMAADDMVILDQRARRLDKAVGKLSDTLKAPLLLTMFEGYSQQEAGEILGLSTKTIETRVYRARKLLAAQLDDDMRPSKG